MDFPRPAPPAKYAAERTVRVFRDAPREGRFVSWLLAAAWTGVLFAVIPYARPMQRWLADHPRFSIGVAVAVVMLVTALGVAVVAHYGLRRIWRRLFWLGLAGGTTAYLAVTETSTPSEAIHFINYGVLSLLFFRALSHNVRDRMVFPCAVLLAGLAGTVDEMLQWLNPARVWDFNDIQMNVVAAAITQAGFWLGVRPRVIRDAIRPASVRLLRRLLLAELALLTLSLANTPSFVRFYAERFPSLERQMWRDAMAEYGHRIELPGDIMFKSRFTADRLAAEDAKQAARLTTVIRVPVEWDRLNELLQTCNTGAEPFLHEFLVHMHRRDRYWGSGWRFPLGSPDHRAHMTIAVRENNILEAFYPRSLRAIGGVWSEELRARAVSFSTQGPYRSPVSKNLFTRLNEAQTLVLMVCGMISLHLIFRRWEKRLARSAAASRGPSGMLS